MIELTLFQKLIVVVVLFAIFVAGAAALGALDLDKRESE